MKSILTTLLLVSSAGLTQADVSHTIVVDGLANESFWQDAQQFDQFLTVEPFTQQTAPLSQRVKLHALPTGLAVFFDIDHPADIPRTKPQTQRDQLEAADRVNLIIDYDGKGQTAYNFTVSLSGAIEDGIASRNQFRNDWDGDWQSAVHETEQGWSVEMFVPWTIAPMEPVSGDTRTVGIYLDRVVKARGERFAFPAVRFSQSDFINSFTSIAIPAYSNAQSHVYPYVSVLHDRVTGDNKTRAGVDVFYKPSSHFQLIAALNPDFGQVESDDLVIDFSATETFFSDKRPFFTENNDDFNLPLPEDGLLVYTRRIGGERADDKGVADIDAAIKWRTATNGFSLAYMGAQEADYNNDIGRRFQIVRPRVQWLQTYFGYSLLHTDTPFDARQATVSGPDIDSHFADNWRLRTQWLHSDIAIADEHTRDDGSWLTLDYTPGVDSQHSFEWLDYGADFNVRDMGYVQRSDLRKYQWHSAFLFGDFSDTSTLKELGINFTLARRHNNAGDDLGHFGEVEFELRNQPGDLWTIGGHYIAAGIDDEIARGNGVWARNGRFKWWSEISTARRGDGNWVITLESDNDGLRHNYHGVVLKYKHYFSETLNGEFKTYYFVTPDWLYWQQDNQFVHYRRARDYHLGVALNWFPLERHEWRLKTQWLASTAHQGSHYQLLNETMVPEHTAAERLIVNIFGLQLRYRYRLGSLSDLFVVYSRGGTRDDSEQQTSTHRLFEDALQLRDADQLLVKVRMQF